VRILKGDVYVDVSDDSGLTAAQVSTVTSLMQAVVASGADPGSNNAEGDVARVSVVVNSGTVDMSALRNIAGDLTISATGTGSVNLGALVEIAGQASIGTEASINMSSLARVTGDYYVSGHDIDDQALATVGLSSSSANVTLNYEGGYVQPNLATVYGGLYIVDYAAAAGDDAEGNGTTSVDFRGLESVSNFATITSEDADAHHSGGGSSAGTSASTTDAPTGGTAYTLVLRSATSVIFGEAAVVSITANEATSIDHNYSGSLDSLDITANSATTVNVSATDVTGATTIDSGANTTVSVTSDLADVTITDGLTVTLSGDISGTATMNPAATASVTLSGSTVNDLDVNSGATYDIDALLTTVDFVDAGSSVDITGAISGAANFALASGDLTITGNLLAAINVTDETAENVTITGNIVGAAAFAMADGGALSITGDLDSALTVSDNTASTVTVDGTVGGAVTIASKADAEISITGAITDALTITGDPASVTLGGSVTGAVNATIATDATFTSSGGFGSSLNITGGNDINLNGTADADGAVSITGVAANGDITISNELDSSLTITGDGADLVTYTGTAIDGAVNVDMDDTGAFVATSLTSFGSTVSIDSATITAGSLASIGGPATFANAASINFPNLLGAAAGITANTATTVTLNALNSATPITATSAVVFSATEYTVNANLTLGTGVQVTVSDVDAAVDGDMTYLFATAATVGSLTITELSDPLYKTDGFLAMTSLNMNSLANTTSLSVSDDNAGLASATVSGTWNEVSFGDDTESVGEGLAALTSVTTSGTMKSFIVTNTAILENITTGHTEDSPAGIAERFTNNASLLTITTSADRAYEFVVTGNDALTAFNASSYQNVPADADSAPDKVDFYFLVFDNGLTGTHQPNDASNEQSFAQSSLLTLANDTEDGYIQKAYAAVAADTEGAASSITVALNFTGLVTDDADSATSITSSSLVVGHPDATIIVPAGVINELVEVNLITSN
jgi:hypothetical protein